MNKKIIIRRAILLDAEKIFQIEKSCFGEAEATVRESFEQIIGNKNYYIYVLCYEGEIAGFYCAILDGDRAHLADLAVSPDLQKRGLGSLLLNHCLKKIKGNKCQSLILTVRTMNYSAQKLYKKKGFKEVECIRNYYGDEDGLRLEYLP